MSDDDWQIVLLKLQANNDCEILGGWKTRKLTQRWDDLGVEIEKTLLWDLRKFKDLYLNMKRLTFKGMD